MCWASAVAALGCALAAPAAAQAGAEMVRDLAGPWQIVPTDGRPACPIELTARRAGDGWAARPGPSCAARVPGAAAATAWRLEDGATLLVDATGRTRMTFVEDETALPSSPDLVAPRHYLIPAIAGFARLPQAADWTGAWRIGRAGGAPCRITLGPMRAGAGPVASACKSGAPARLGRWSLQGLKLILSGRGDALIAFAPAGHGRYRAEAGGWTLSR